MGDLTFEDYIFGADVPFDDPAYKGPWDCNVVWDLAACSHFGKTIEAMDSRRDVTEGSPEHRLWNVCFLIDGIDYP